ncbi:hypothetical protein KY289_017028 [Solanum tuberosum]|nr:hypothetical protein KY284_016819 [Solanum tuberosum]KAH0689670.1 hypothetical protein KY289_017028 [Solanum tuberosum]
MTWILRSIDPFIVLNLRPYKTAKAMWDYLQKVYNQDNSAKRFQLEELLREEQCPVTQNAYKKENDVTVAFATQGTHYQRVSTRPQNCRVNAFQARINGSTIDNSSSGQVLTPEMVQQMIVSAFSALGLQGSGVGDDNNEGA